MSETFHHQTIVRADAGAVWDALQQASVWENIAGVSEVTNPRHHDDGRLAGYDLVVDAGPSRIRGTSTVIESRTPSLMRQRIDSSEIAGVLTTELSVEELDMTALNVTIELRARGFMSMMAMPLITQVVRSGLPEQITSFATRLEGA